MKDIKITADFRRDINGLRAWAVVAVILYHFGVPGFGGGFVGVDVFFVISGFLMTGIVIRGLERAQGGGRILPHGVLHGKGAAHTARADRFMRRTAGAGVVAPFTD